MGSLVNSLALSVQSLQKMIKNVEMKHEHRVFKDMEDSTLLEAYGRVGNKFCVNVPISSNTTLGFSHELFY